MKRKNERDKGLLLKEEESGQICQSEIMIQSHYIDVSTVDQKIGSSHSRAKLVADLLKLIKYKYIITQTLSLLSPC